MKNNVKKTFSIITMFLLIINININKSQAATDENTEYTFEVGNIEKENFDINIKDSKAEPIFNCNNWNNFKKVSSTKSTAYSLHQDFVKWSNANGYTISTGSGKQWITFTAGYNGASASVTVGKESTSGRYFKATYPKGKKYSRIYNNHPGTLYKYKHVENLCPYKYTFTKSAIVYKIVYK